MKAGVMEEVKRLFKPEFLNRIDETIVFHQLTKRRYEANYQSAGAEPDYALPDAAGYQPDTDTISERAYRRKNTAT